MAEPDREAPSYIWLRECAASILAAARRDANDAFAPAMSALILTALMAETFFDVLGNHIDPHWPNKGRRFSRYKRLRVFRLALDIDGDIKARPYRSVADAFDFHDLVVRGRIEADEKREALALSEDELAAYVIGEDWRDFCTLANAEKIFEDVEAVINGLSNSAGLKTFAPS